VCDTRVSLLDRAETADKSHHALVADMSRAAQVRRDLDAAALTLRAKMLANAYDVFFSYDSADEERVAELDALLKEQGILAWHPGPHVAHTQIRKSIDEAMAASNAFAFFVGSSSFSKWQMGELRTALELRRDKRRLFIVLLRGDALPKLPSQLAEFQVVSMPEFTPAAMQQLVEAIDGQNSTYIDPDAAAEPAIAYRILSASLFQGLLTGRGGRNFIRGRRADKKKLLTRYSHRESAHTIASQARKFESVLRPSLISPESAARQGQAHDTPERSRTATRKRILQRSPRKNSQKRPKKK
jgi:hypothetical protein